ncbi:hypothetical protein [Sphingomonas sp.]|uniref:hypothetical protein n=1 Tax=Sphingomonas sp. TaxID=28214 RepID=UPI003D6C93EC
MKYVQPIKITSKEILDTLKRRDVAPADRISTVLSAVYYGESVEFSGDVLIKEFSGADYNEKIYLKNIFETFHQMYQTTYRIDESISLLEEYKRKSPENTLEIEDTIDSLIEYKVIFRKS